MFLIVYGSFLEGGVNPSIDHGFLEYLCQLIFRLHTPNIMIIFSSLVELSPGYRPLNYCFHQDQTPISSNTQIPNTAKSLTFLSSASNLDWNTWISSSLKALILALRASQRVFLPLVNKRFSCTHLLFGRFRMFPNVFRMKHPEEQQIQIRQIQASRMFRMFFQGLGWAMHIKNINVYIPSVGEKEKTFGKWRKSQPRGLISQRYPAPKVAKTIIRKHPEHSENQSRQKKQFPDLFRTSSEPQVRRKQSN